MSCPLRFDFRLRGEAAQSCLARYAVIASRRPAAMTRWCILTAHIGGSALERVGCYTVPNLEDGHEGFAVGIRNNRHHDRDRHAGSGPKLSVVRALRQRRRRLELRIYKLRAVSYRHQRTWRLLRAKQYLQATHLHGGASGTAQAAHTSSTADGARPIAVNIAKLPDLLQGGAKA